MVPFIVLKMDGIRVKLIMLHLVIAFTLVGVTTCAAAITKGWAALRGVHGIALSAKGVIFC